MPCIWGDARLTGGSVPARLQDGHCYDNGIAIADSIADAVCSVASLEETVTHNGISYYI